jgi:glutathione S-transferase
MNLERRTKWHYFLNNGFVPILETPEDNPLFGKHYIIFESRNIMDFLDSHLQLGLYSKDSFKKAEQLHIMNLLD